MSKKAVSHKSLPLTFARYILMMLGFLYFTSGTCQTTPYKNYSIKDGLPSSEIYYVMQDSKGFMWFCTDGGVSRFDGYEFKNFNKHNGLPDHDIFEATEDYKGRIWFRSLSGKLSYYYNDSIYCLPVNDTIVKLLKHSFISSLSIDTSDVLYAGVYGYSKPFRINLRNRCSFSALKYSSHGLYLISTPGRGLINGSYTSIVEEKKTDTLVSLFKLNEAGEMDKIIEYTSPRGPTHSNDRVTQLPNKQIATSFYSTFIVFDSLHKQAYSHEFLTEILSVSFLRDGKTWLSFVSYPPVCYYKGKIVQYRGLQFLKDKRVTCITQDADGGYWVTTLTDGAYYLPSLNYKTWTTENGLSGNKINCIVLGPDSSLWLPIFGNPVVPILQKDSLTNQNFPAIPGLSINSLLFHPDKTVWVNSTQGLFIFRNIKSFNSTYFRLSDGGNGLLLNADGSVWEGTPAHISLYRQKSDTLTPKTKIKINSTILRIYKEGEGRFYISTANGLFEYSGGKVNYAGDSNPFFKNVVTDFALGPDSNLYMTTTGAGVLVKTKKQVYNITTRDGLVSDYCKAICTDTRGNIWVGTKIGLSHIFIKKTFENGFEIEHIKNFTSPNLTEINCLACYNNTICVGTNNGFTEFNPDKVMADTIPPPVYITSVKVNDIKMSGQDTCLTLNCNQNYIVLSYLGIDYSSEGKVNYRYKILGIDTAWKYTMSRNVQYPDLQPGNYTFLVSAMNNDGLWNTHPARFHFIIAPPVWATWWAEIIYALLLIGAVYTWIKSIEKREKRKTEITRQLAAAEVRELKSQFDPHFLFNSLNTLAHLVENKLEEAPEFVNELSKFYRYALQYRNNELMELQTELVQAKRYIHLLKIRFADQLEVSWNIDEHYNNYLIPTYSLQLLIENAVKHNIVGPAKPLKLEIKTTPEKAIEVMNELHPKTGYVQSTGHGLQSISDRYKLLTGKNITVVKTTDIFCVTLPLISREEYESAPS